MMYLIKTNKAFNKDFILYSIVLLSLFFIALTTLNAQSKPDAPTIELVQVQATHTTVQWNPVTDATFYYIFVCNETNQCNIGILYDANHNQKTTPYLQTITPLTPNTSYSITITAYANNQWSDYSNWIHIKTKKEDTIPLTQQTNQGQQNQQNNPQTPQQPEQQQSPQQDQQQGGVQQQTPQQQNNPPACRWEGSIIRESSCNGETSVMTLSSTTQTLFCGYEGSSQCQGNCYASSNKYAPGELFFPSYGVNTYTFNCKNNNQLCVPDGRRCIEPQGVCAWRDAGDATKRTCLTKKDLLIEPRTKQVCSSASGSTLCSGTCWGLRDTPVFVQGTLQNSEEKPRGSVQFKYTGTKGTPTGTRIESCSQKRCATNYYDRTKHQWVYEDNCNECRNGRCVFVEPKKVSSFCNISPPNPDYRCTARYGKQDGWSKEGVCKKYETTPYQYRCFKTCYENWSDGSVRSTNKGSTTTTVDKNQYDDSTKQNSCKSQIKNWGQ